MSSPRCPGTSGSIDIKQAALQPERAMAQRTNNSLPHFMDEALALGPCSYRARRDGASRNRRPPRRCRYPGPQQAASTPSKRAQATPTRRRGEEPSAERGSLQGSLFSGGPPFLVSGSPASHRSFVENTNARSGASNTPAQTSASDNTSLLFSWRWRHFDIANRLSLLIALMLHLFKPVTTVAHELEPIAVTVVACL